MSKRSTSSFWPTKTRLISSLRALTQGPASRTFSVMTLVSVVSGLAASFKAAAESFCMLRKQRNDLR